MFKFKNAIFTIYKQDETTFKLEYNNMITCNKYDAIIDLQNYIFDSVDVFCEYLKDLKAKKILPSFEFYKKNDIYMDCVKISFPFEIKYSKKNSFIIFELMRQFQQCETDVSLLQQKITMLENKIEENFVIRSYHFFGKIGLNKDIVDIFECEYENETINEHIKKYTELDKINVITYFNRNGNKIMQFQNYKYDDILQIINKNLIPYCKNCCYIKNSHHFELLNYNLSDSNNSNNKKLFILCDANNEPIVKYGCIYVFYPEIENNMIDLSIKCAIPYKYFDKLLHELNKKKYEQNSILYKIEYEIESNDLKYFKFISVKSRPFFPATSHIHFNIFVNANDRFRDFIVLNEEGKFRIKFTNDYNSVHYINDRMYCNTRQHMPYHNCDYTCLNVEPNDIKFDM